MSIINSYDAAHIRWMLEISLETELLMTIISKRLEIVYVLKAK